LADRVDLATGALVIESLKKRRTGIYRAVPVPPSLLDAPTWRKASANGNHRGKDHDVRLWPWSG
jgi:integrase/recombinase XerD